MSPCPTLGVSPCPPELGGLTLMSPPHRFDGQQHWMRRGSHGHPDLLSFCEVPVVALDLSGSPVTYDGLDNLGEPLKTPLKPLGDPSDPPFPPVQCH